MNLSIILLMIPNVYDFSFSHRGFAAGIYTTNSPEACEYCAKNSRANIIVVEDSKQLEKILQVKKNLPNLKAIIQYDGFCHDKNVLSVNTIQSHGRLFVDEQFFKRLIKQLFFSSGTIYWK